MLLYKCRFTHDELCSDAFKPVPVLKDGEEVPGLFEIESTKINKDSGASVDIGCGSEFGGGGDDVDENADIVNNVIDETLGFNLQEVPMGKRDLKEYLGGYCKKVRQTLKDDEKVTGPEVKKFTQAAPIFCKHLLSMYDELLFYISESMDPDGAMVFAYYKGADPTFVYITGGLYEEKC